MANHKIILKCRVCLSEEDENEMHELFPKNQSVNDNDDGETTPKLYEKVEYCCGVRIRESPELPTKICFKCFDITRMWYNFRQICLNSQVYLESLCHDSPIPADIKNNLKTESAYLEYLLQDLQTFRTDMRQTYAELAHEALDTSSISDHVEEEHIEDDEKLFAEIEIAEYDEFGNVNEDALVQIKPEFIKDENQNKKGNNKEKLKSSPKTEVKKMPTKKPTDTNATAVSQNKNEQEKGVARKRHQRAPSPTTYMCSICGNVYNKKSSFSYHMSLHKNIKPHECELCGKAFRQVCELRNHMRRHTGEKPYKCTYCERHFIDRSEKLRHERVHTNTRPYKCNICGKSFMHSAILKNHSKLHSGEKDFNCLVCQKAFTLQHQLKAHLLTITHKQKENQFVQAGYEVVYE